MINKCVYIIALLLFINNTYAQHKMASLFYNQRLIGVFPKSIDLSDTSDIPLHDTIFQEFDAKGNLIEYCFYTYFGDCDFFIYKKHELHIVAHFKPSYVLSNKKAKVYFIDGNTFRKTYRMERVYKAKRSGVWIYYDHDGNVVKKKIYSSG